METESNWKPTELNFNHWNRNNEDSEIKQLMEIIENSKKQKLQEIFDKAIEYGYEKYKKHLFEKHLFLFEELENNIKESTYCLIIGAKTASITNTNLILERAIKLCLIQFEVGMAINYEDQNNIKKYLESDRKYSGKNLDQNIQTCGKLGILTKSEAEELKNYKLKFRDGFSHFTPKNILKDEESQIYVADLDEKIELELKTPTFQALSVRQFANNKAEEHLIYVLKIINHLQQKVLEKFRENNTKTTL